MNDRTIESLTAGLVAGEPAAVEEWYRRYFGSLYAIARHVSGRGEAESLDIVHDAVLRILRTIRPVTEERQLVAWQSLVVRTTAYDQLKMSQRRQRRQDRFARERTEQAEVRDEDLDDRLAALRSGIARLDPAIVELIDRRFAKGWTLAKVAESVGLSIGTVDGRLRRAMRTLADGINANPRSTPVKP